MNANTTSTDEMAMLSRKAQTRLLAAVATGREALASRDADDLDADEAGRLRALIRTGRRASERLLLANMKLVDYLAHRWHRL